MIKTVAYRLSNLGREPFYVRHCPETGLLSLEVDDNDYYAPRITFTKVEFLTFAQELYEVVRDLEKQL